MSDVEFKKVERAYDTVISQESAREVRKWRREGKIDRSKRTYAATPEVSEKNVLSKNQTRPRPAYNYFVETKEAHFDVGQVVAESGVFPKKKKAPKSENTYEKRLARAMELLSVKGKKVKKDVKDEAESSDEEEKENVENKEEPVKKAEVEESDKKVEEAKTSSTQVRSRQGRKSVGARPTSPSAPQVFLNSKVISQLKRLGATASPVTESRAYSNRATLLPKAVQEFIDAKWPEKKQYMYTPNDVVFNDFSEFVLKAEELESFKFITDHPDDFVLLADGERILATLQSDTSSDFQVYIISEEEKTVGPVRISQFLKDLEAQDRTEDSSVNVSQVDE